MQDGNELYHYGKIGMRWGQHKYLDKYGGMTAKGQVKRKQLENEHDRLDNIQQLTSAGIKRKSEVAKQYEQLTGKPIGERTTVPRPKPKSVNEMTNEELTAYNNRKQLETTYQGYQPKPHVSKGKLFVTTVSTKILIPAAIDAGKAYVTSIATDKIMGKDMTKAATNATKQATKSATKATNKALNSLKK